MKSRDDGAASTKSWGRVSEWHAENGWRNLGGCVTRRLRSALRFAWRRLAQHRNHIFVHDPDAPRVNGPVGLNVSRYERLEDVPPSVAHQLQLLHGSSTLKADRWELEHHAVLWIATLNGRVVGTSMSRRGRHFRKWFLPLAANDVVIFRNATVREFRGIGICPSMMGRIVQVELEDGARAYVDCRVYNRPSIRSIQKAGFRRIATKRPLKRKEAVG